MYITLSKVETHEIEQCEKLLNTAYTVVKHNRPYTDYEACLNLINQVVNGFFLRFGLTESSCLQHIVGRETT